MAAKKHEQAKTSQSERPRRRHLDDGSFVRLPQVISTHNTPPGLTRQIAIKSPQSTYLHRWYLTHCGSQSLDTDLQHPFYYVATVVLPPPIRKKLGRERRWPRWIKRRCISVSSNCAVASMRYIIIIIVIVIIIIIIIIINATLSWTNADLTHWGRDKMAAIFQTTFTNGFSWMKIYEFRLTFHWSLFIGVQLTIYQHWFR